MGNSSSSAVGYNSTITTTSSNLHRILKQTWIEDWIAADVIPIDELTASFAEWKYSHSKAWGILRGTSAITSVISSCIFMWMIMRSHDGLSTTQHRLLLGLCISDIISSLSSSTFNIHAPSENDYEVWNARGNDETCLAQGFLVMLGVYGGVFYNASLNLFFLAVVKFNKSDEFIRAKIEPFLHGVPIVLALSYSVYLLVEKHFNDIGEGMCYWPVNIAPHCKGYDVGQVRQGFEIPCWRGMEGAWTTVISSITLFVIPILIMIVSLGMIYSVVRTQEKKLSRYGVGALRANLQQQSVSTAQPSGVSDRIRTSLSALMTSLKSRKWSRRKAKKPFTRSNSVQSQSHAVMHKAFGYTFAWFLSYGFVLADEITELATGSFPLVLNYFASICSPLQGFFNLLIFMYPKIMAAKKSKKRAGETVSWCQAFSTAFWSRGKRGSNQGTNRSNLRGDNSNRGQKKKTRSDDAASDYVKSQKKKKTKRASNISQEEEKCEIQVPDHLNPIKTKAMYSAASTAIYAPNMVPSSDTTTMGTVDRMEKVNFGDDNINVGNKISDVLVEEADEDIMLNQDEEENAADIFSLAADGLVSSDVKEQKEILMGNQDVSRGDEMNMDADVSELQVASMDTTA